MISLHIGIEKISDEEIQDVTSNAGLDHDKLWVFIQKLGLQPREIRHAKTSAGTDDSRKQAATALEIWRKLYKDATKKTVLSALEECEYHEAVEILQVKWDLKTEGTTAEGMFLPSFLTLPL